RIWITRAQPAADVTADRVRALGHEALVAPLLAVRTLPEADVSLSGIAALAFTSADGVRAFADRSGERTRRVCAVGAAPAPAPKLRALGLSKAVIKPLSRTPLAAKAFPPMPLEAALLNLIDRTA